MLVQLAIHNFALIRELELSFKNGLTIVSGETGAGKSIFLDAISFVSGKRASRDFVRRGADQADVTCLFQNVMDRIPPDLLERLRLPAFEQESDELLLYREIDINGRSVAKVNGRMVTVSLLRELGDLLFAIHAQHEQVTLFNTEKQQELLDAYAGGQLSEFKKEWKEIRLRRIEGAKNLKKLGINPHERERQLDLLNFQIAEIEAGMLSEKEVEDLKNKFRELMAVEQVKQALQEAIKLLDDESEYSVLSLLELLMQPLHKQEKHSEALANFNLRLAECSDCLKVILDEMKEYLLSLLQNETDISELQLTLEKWDSISRKYGPSWHEVNCFLEECKEERQRLIDSERTFHSLRNALREDEGKAESLAEAMHKVRNDAGQDLADKIEKSLASLNMQGSKFEIRVEKAKAGEANFWAAEGRDRISFYISPNTGEDLMPLEKIASGGEASRILLAIKSILAELEDIPVLIFDEIDSGISGDTAFKLGRALYKLGNRRQSIAVSHTAQIAAMADSHILFYKDVFGGRTETLSKQLSYEERVAELSRLLVGNEEDATASELAINLLHQHYEDEKNIL